MTRFLSCAKILGTKKIGHGGTLDPDGGCLPIAVGKGDTHGRVYAG